MRNSPAKRIGRGADDSEVCGCWRDVRVPAAQAVLDALPDLLRADAPAGDALRVRLGLTPEKGIAHFRLGPVDLYRFVTDWEPQP